MLKSLISNAKKKKRKKTSGPRKVLGGILQLRKENKKRIKSTVPKNRSVSPLSYGTKEEELEKKKTA